MLYRQKIKKQIVQESYKQLQLVYISEDRVVTIQYTAQVNEYPKYVDEVVKVFTSYQTLAMAKVDE
jgi:hypothetical protein